MSNASCRTIQVVPRVLQAIFLLAWMVAAVPALAGEAIVNTDISVDVTGKDAADARSQAMAKAEVGALLDLLGKIAPGQEKDIVAMLDAPKISSLVKATEVLDEKMSNNRYRATLRVSFDADEVSGLITKFTATAANEVPVSATGSFLIIPVYDDGTVTKLWEADNPWAQTWKMLGLETTSGDIVVPYGDNMDSGTVNVSNVSTVLYNNLTAMALRYGVSDIVILQAKFTSVPDMSLAVVKRRINRTRNEINMLTYRADPQETRDMLLMRAARDMAYTLANKKTEELAQAQGVRGGERNQKLMLVTISTLDSWTQVRKKLSSLPMVDRIELVAMSQQQADMRVHYRGSEESLENALVAQKIRLVKNKDYWVLSRD